MTESSVRAKLVLRAALLSAACALSLFEARAGQSVPPRSSMLDGAVTYTLPAGWHISMYMNRSTHGSAEIRNTKKVMEQSRARFFLSAHFVAEGKTVVDVGADASWGVLRKTNGSAVLSDKSDGKDWRTVVTTRAANGQRSLVLERFGVINRKFVGLTAVVPLDSGDVELMKQIVADFNAACESLKIDGQGGCDNKVGPDIITEQLKAGAKRWRQLR